MSGWRVGREGVERPEVWMDVNAAPEEDAPLQRFLSTLEKWLPAETLAIYAPGIVLIQGDNTASEPALWFLVVMLVVSPLFVILGSFAATGGAPSRKTAILALLSATAFLIWSTAIPGNGWQSFDVVVENRGAVAVLGSIAAATFAFVAEGISKRYLE